MQTNFKRETIQACRPTWTDGQTDRQNLSSSQSVRQAYRQTDRQAGIQTDRQTGRQTDRRTDGQKIA